ncbi:MAG: HAMP domain-containing protein [Chloroflexi bacterium]|nr:HAMP domain-containing protein [Chloroflexota bacterium]
MNKVLRRPGLGVKLNLYVLFVLLLFLVSIVFLLNRNTDSLTKQVGSDRVGEEVKIFEKRLAETQDKLLIDINFLATSLHFFQAVGRRSANDVAEIINPANVSLKLDDITVVDGDGNRLIDTAADQTDFSAEDRLLAVGLSGQETIALLIENNRGQTQISIAAVSPVLSQTGNRLGAILMSRRINEQFLDEMTFGRAAVHMGVVHNDQIIARTGAVPPGNGAQDQIVANDILIDSDPLAAAQRGQAVILDELVSGARGVPHAVAYVPILAGTETSSVVVVILVELEEIYSFQNDTLNNTVFIFTALTMLSISIIYIAIFSTTIRPLNELRTIAHTMTSGQYDQRAPVHSQDEVGQLSTAFNEMANAIQQRETSLKEAWEQAERADKVKSMFLASVSHELRTPLNAIINLTKFVALGMYGEINAEQSEMLNNVVASGKHLLNLINDVLDISKIESDSLELFVEEGLHIEDIIQPAIETANGLVLQKPITIACEIEPELPALTGDEQRIRQVVLNLLSNACKFTDEGQITLSVYRQDSEIIIAVRDTGPGIARDDHEAIFESFRQAKSGVRKAEGTGLGLPISRRLAEAHDGRLWVESALGEGATFYVALPIKSSLVPTI